MELLLIRHAEPVRIAPGEGGGGPVDPGLTARGRIEAERLATWLAAEPVDAVISSPLRRARQTAEPVTRAHGLDLEIGPDLIEYDANADHYIPAEELKRGRDARWLAMLEGRWEEFGGEAPDQFRGRIVPCLDAIVGRFPGGRVAVVCHGGVINVYVGALLGLDRHLWFEPGYTSITRVAAARSGPRSLVTLNETAHLLGVRDRAADPPPEPPAPTS
ncbi:MAG: histidine phosphatase family protein [Actinobacteria bacterium]|nr:histidine phosphatase family protein [Actinomycetota bacterium]